MRRAPALAGRAGDAAAAAAAVADDAGIAVRIDGRTLRVPPGTLVAAALEIDACGAGARRAPRGELRQAYCGMGVCGECRVAIDGRAHRLGCQVLCAPGMEIRRDE
jgi:hypothetical protein